MYTVFKIAIKIKYFYFILLATLKLCTFHQNLLALFEPLVDDYLTGLDTSITNDLKVFFDNETWLPVS